MLYKFATTRPDYTDLAGGRVLYGLPGRPALPVRLTDELFQRCLAACTTKRTSSRVTLYDPCCGGAYHLAVIGLLHGDALARITASDIDPTAVEIAGKNLALLSPRGLARRMEEIEQRAAHFGKASHADALGSARRLQAQLAQAPAGRPLPVHAFVADALCGPALLQGLDAGPVDMVLTDVPYGRHARWQGAAATEPHADPQTGPLWRLLDALTLVVKRGGIVGVITDKGQQARHDAYARVERFQIGKRRIEVLRLAAPAAVRA